MISGTNSGGSGNVVSPEPTVRGGGHHPPDSSPAAPITDLNGYDAQSIREGKRGQVKFFFDPTHIIAKSFGGRQWFFDEGILQLHRVGLLSGLGWILPYTGGNMDINCIRVVWAKDRSGAYYNIECGRVNRDSANPPETWELVKLIADIHHTELLASYKEIVG